MPHQISSCHMLMISITRECSVVQVYRELKWCFYNVCVCVGVRVHAGERSVQSPAAPQLFPNGKYVFL